MGEQMNDTEMNNPEAIFQNFTILKEFSNIANFVRNEDFLETVPKGKFKRVKWVPMFNCLKQGILDEMVQEMSSMWEFENMPEKLDILEKQKEKFAEINPKNTVWRPQHNDVISQLRASDVANLRKQKTLLESLAKEYEARAARLKKSVTAKRGYLKALQMDIQKYEKQNEETVYKIGDKIINHKKLADIMVPKKLKGDLKWSEREMDVYE